MRLAAERRRRPRQRHALEEVETGGRILEERRDGLRHPPMGGYLI